MEENISVDPGPSGVYSAVQMRVGMTAKKKKVSNESRLTIFKQRNSLTIFKQR